jgi:hypothetical protein
VLGKCLAIFSAHAGHFSSSLLPIKIMVNSQCQCGNQIKLSLCQIHEEKHRKAALRLLGAVSGVISVLGHLLVESHVNKQPMHTSALSGQQ